jgi:GNAT superfamily N-acetyltransferase
MSRDAMRLSFRRISLQHDPAASLVSAMRAEMSALYDELDIDAPDMPWAGPLELGPPGGAFLVGFDATGRPICCGGLKRLSDDTCEIKRMYVITEARRRGVGRQLLTALESEALELGYGVVRLDTGPRQPDAERMYRRAGYRAIGNFNANPMASFFGEKVLT